jgi:hypothetical protein
MKNELKVLTKMKMKFLAMREFSYELRILWFSKLLNFSPRMS